MESHMLDLNVPLAVEDVQSPVLEEHFRLVDLQKDGKRICWATSANLPIEAPPLWTISELKLRNKQHEVGLAQCRLHPKPNHELQMQEWRRFLKYLSERGKVAIVPSEYCVLYICAPEERSELAYAVVMYKMIKKNASFDKQEIRTSGCIKTDPSYLRTPSQVHAGWIFGAIAELVDNSCDAKASRLDISIECRYSQKAGKKIPLLSMIDDGHGMSHTDIHRMLSFGHKQPDEEDKDRIGRFGIGFKTGAMKLGRDALVLTQTFSSRSIALLSQSYNENKEDLEIPIITYRRDESFAEVDTSVLSEASANFYMKAIKEFSSFNEIFIGEKFALFGKMGTGTQIYIWNLDEWGSNYTLEWDSGRIAEGSSHKNGGDILIRSRIVRKRLGQMSQQVPLDYSLQAYLGVIFSEPRMKILVQDSLVKSRPLAKFLSKTVVLNGQLMGRTVSLTIGYSPEEWERMNCGIFLYWHGRLIEAYKRVGRMVHNTDMGRGVIGVVDVTDIMDGANHNVWVLNNKQGFHDCEAYAKLEEWLANKADAYLDHNIDAVEIAKGDRSYKLDHEWVQCDKCRKWRILSTDFDSKDLPPEWFCYMPPFEGSCEIAEQPVAGGAITVAIKRSGYGNRTDIQQQEEILKKAKNATQAYHEGDKKSQASTLKQEQIVLEVESDAQSKDDIDRPKLKRLRRGPSRRCKRS